MGLESLCTAPRLGGPAALVSQGDLLGGETAAAAAGGGGGRGAEGGLGDARGNRGVARAHRQARVAVGVARGQTQV
jgi:hypothetical protein